MTYSSLASIQKQLLAGELTVQELAGYYLGRARESADYNAYVEVFDEELQNAAAKLDKKIQERPGELGRLFGAVVSIKDNLCYAGHIASASSRMLEDYTSPLSATAVERLLAEDALIIGRTNCDEFSMGSTGTLGYYGAVHNAVHADAIAGGSSSGAAVSCKLDTCLVALGSDTGGSVRQPAAYNGVIGFKPSYGMVSRWGLIAYASSLDQISVIGHNIDDVRAVTACMAGEDRSDSTSIEFDSSGFDSARVPSRPRLARIDNFFEQGMLSEEVKAGSDLFFQSLENQGYVIEDITLDFAELLVPCYYILCTAEASSNLARYDGIRYGYASDLPVSDYREMIKNNRTESLGKEVKKRIILGNYVLSEGYREAYFQKALDIRKMIRFRMDRFFEIYDYIFLPVTSTTAWNRREGPADEMEVYKGDVFTILANLAGLPALSLPIHNNSSQMPLGIQIIAQRLKDPSLLAFADRLGR